jgi:hypothetical protein
MNKLFCTFAQKDLLDSVLLTIKETYPVAYNKVYVLETDSMQEYLCTYNISGEDKKAILTANTILLHRKKETNTLYTINSLNELIKQLNNGILDVTYRVNWSRYRNTILLTQNSNLKQYPTRLVKVVVI